MTIPHLVSITLMNPAANATPCSKMEDVLPSWYRSRSSISVRNRPVTPGPTRDSDIMKELNVYRKLMVKRPLLPKENKELIKTIQKVKRLPLSLKCRDVLIPTKTATNSSSSVAGQVEDSDPAERMSASEDDDRNKRMVEKMRSDEDLLDSFRQDFFKLMESRKVPQGNDANSDPVTEKGDGEDGCDCDSKTKIEQCLVTATVTSSEMHSLRGGNDPQMLHQSDQLLASDSTVSMRRCSSINKRSPVPTAVLRRSLSAVSFFSSSGVSSSLLESESPSESSLSTSSDGRVNLQEINSSSSSENHSTTASTQHHPQENSIPLQHAHSVRGVSSDLYRTLDRRIERERRIRTEPAVSSTRVDSRGMFGGDFPPVDPSLPRNGFRPGSRQPYFQKNEHSFVTTSYRYGNPKDYGAPLSSISGSDGNTNSTVQGYRVGISSRERQTRPTTQRNIRIRNSTSYSSSVDKSRGFVYADAVPGASQAFQQRLIEIANLEGDTIRYERMRKVKKKPKQP